ncbi:MAG: glutamate racemase [Melioribacteraceae bacterium]|nr:glutamate racemase [Melioribacteraceae bacterium]MCF8355717.1 glutamate racemase [Melioribacteraceae bacterium]MCF8394447.1 glutamate racemase [Melioribacteraceae bacterium]MCF8418581.1 glutamate racemase [Melioribacteraceae bacterium]
MNFFNRSNPIGIFDSGIGGLTVVKKIASYLPSESIVYFGDTARVPYGSKSNDTVIEYSLQDARFLLSKNVKLIVVACNTASSVAIDALRNELEIPVIGMIEPGAKMALETTKNERIGVIGTYATINNKAYSNQLQQLNNKVEVFEKACPLFVPLAEEGWTDHKATYEIAEEYLKELRDKKIDTLILGCTHYPILSKVIQEVIGNDVTLIDSGTAASGIVENHLEGRNLKTHYNGLGRHDFYVSDIQTKFKDIAERFLGRPLDYLQKIDLEELKSHSGSN